MATRDPMNQVYAAWLYNVAKGSNLPYTNCERLGDVVEAGLGLLYLASMFTTDLEGIVDEPNTMWRRIETSIAAHHTWNCPLTFGRSTGRSAGQLITTPVILKIQQTLVPRPYIAERLRKKETLPKDTLPTPVADVQIRIPAELSGNYQFCEK